MDASMQVRALRCPLVAMGIYVRGLMAVKLFVSPDELPGSGF